MSDQNLTLEGQLSSYAEASHPAAKAAIARSMYNSFLDTELWLLGMEANSYIATMSTFDEGQTAVVARGAEEDTFDFFLLDDAGLLVGGVFGATAVDQFIREAQIDSIIHRVYDGGLGKIEGVGIVNTVTESVDRGLIALAIEEGQEAGEMDRSLDSWKMLIDHVAEGSES